MDRQWMYGDRCTMAWINGLKSFLDAAEAHKSLKGFMCCPCRLCQNKKEYSKRSTLHDHIYEKGFMDNYTLWTKCWYFLTLTEKSASAWKYHCSTSPGSIQCIVFP